VVFGVAGGAGLRAPAAPPLRALNVTLCAAGSGPARGVHARLALHGDFAWARRTLTGRKP
jgi:hypothetical protein